MDRSYGTYSSTSTTTRNAGISGTARRTGGYRDIETDYPDDDIHDYDSYDDSLAAPYGDAADDDYDDDLDDIYEYEDPIDRRWIWVAGVAGAILLVAILCTVVILGGGDSGSVSKTVAPPVPPTTPSAVTTATAPPVMTSIAPPPPPAPIAPLSPETVTTVAPSPTAVTPPAPAPAAAPTEVAPVSPRTITYQVTGSRPLLDMVTVVYTDAQGALQTEFNVALPWSRSVTLDPGVELKSVIATSLTGQLNCSVTDSSGTPLVVQNNNSMIATCTR